MWEALHLNTIINSVTIYLFVVICIRLFGKKELAELSISDLVFVLLISNSVQNAMVGDDSSLIGGMLAALTLFLVNKLLKYLLYRSDRFARVMEGEPVVLIRHGKVNETAMKKNRIRKTELEEVARQNGKGGVESIALAILERDGQITILPEEEVKNSSFNAG